MGLLRFTINSSESFSLALNDLGNLWTNYHCIHFSCRNLVPSEKYVNEAIPGFISGVSGQLP